MKTLPKPFKLQEIYQADLEHYLNLATQPGWKAYVWLRIQELEKHESGIWSGIVSDFLGKVNAKGSEKR